MLFWRIDLYTEFEWCFFAFIEWWKPYFSCDEEILWPKAISMEGNESLWPGGICVMNLYYEFELIFFIPFVFSWKLLSETVDRKSATSVAFHLKGGYPYYVLKEAIYF